MGTASAHCPGGMQYQYYYELITFAIESEVRILWHINATCNQWMPAEECVNFTTRRMFPLFSSKYLDRAKSAFSVGQVLLLPSPSLMRVIKKHLLHISRYDD
jgi:hypothetical protein